MLRRERKEQRQELQWGSRRERGRVRHGGGVGKPPQSKILRKTALIRQQLAFSKLAFVDVFGDAVYQLEPLKKQTAYPRVSWPGVRGQ